jgi:hypothetical protein
MGTHSSPGLCAAADVHYLGSEGARAAAVVAADAAFTHVLAEYTALTPEALPCPASSTCGSSHRCAPCWTAYPGSACW